MMNDFLLPIAKAAYIKALRSRVVQNGATASLFCIHLFIFPVFSDDGASLSSLNHMEQNQIVKGKIKL